MSRNRCFGLVLAIACPIIYGIGLWYHAEHQSWLFATGFFLGVTIAMPRILAPLKRLWMELGGLLHLVVSPILLGLSKGATPIGLLMQVVGIDPLRLKSGKATYWIERKPTGPDPRTMTEVF